MDCHHEEHELLFIQAFVPFANFVVMEPG